MHRDRFGAASRFSGEQAADYDARTRVGIPGYDALHDCGGALLALEIGARGRLLPAGAGTGEEIVRLGRLQPGWRFVGATRPQGSCALSGRLP